MTVLEVLILNFTYQCVDIDFNEVYQWQAEIKAFVKFV